MIQKLASLAVYCTFDCVTCSIVLENKHRTSYLSWSQDGSKLIAIDTEGVLHIWRMKVVLSLRT